MEFLQSNLGRQLSRTVPGIALGALAGYAYYYFIGCTTGSCPITSNPWVSTVYGAAMGGLLVPWKRRPKKPQGHTESEGKTS